MLLRGEGKYAILDDEQSFLSHQQSHLVLTNPETGIIKNDVNKIQEFSSNITISSVTAVDYLSIDI